MMKRQASNGEAAAALRAYGKNANMIKWGARTCIAVVVAADVYEIYQSDNRMRTITTKVGGWMTATAWATTGASVLITK